MYFYVGKKFKAGNATSSLNVPQFLSFCASWILSPFFVSLPFDLTPTTKRQDTVLCEAFVRNREPGLKPGLSRVASRLDTKYAKRGRKCDVLKQLITKVSHGLVETIELLTLTNSISITFHLSDLWQAGKRGSVFAFWHDFCVLLSVELIGAQMRAGRERAQLTYLERKRKRENGNVRTGLFF